MLSIFNRGSIPIIGEECHENLEKYVSSRIVTNNFFGTVFQF